MPGPRRSSLALSMLAMCLVAAEAFGENHPSSTQSSFVVYVFFEFTGQPPNSYFSNLGLESIYLTADVTSNGIVTQRLMRSTADAAASYGAYQSRACWDIEDQYQTDATYPAGSPLGFAGAHRIADSLALFLGWARSEQPSLQIGLYGGVPVTNIWLDDTTEWKRNDDTLRALTNALDYFAPSLYLYYAEATLAYSSYAPRHVAEARRLAPTKKVLPFISPAYHPSGPLANTYTDYAGMMNVLNVIKASGADGCIIFAGNGSMGSQYGDWATASTSGWWQAIKDFLGATSSPPSVSTVAASSITTTGAQLNGSVNPEGSATAFHFEYGTTTNYGSSTTAGSAGSGLSSVTFSTTVNALTQGTAYHYRLVATNSGGTTSGNDMSFTTVASPPVQAPPVVTTSAASGVTATGAQINGSVNPNGLSTSYHFDYGRSATYGSSTAAASAGSGSGAVQVHVTLSGLTSGMAYHYRLVATNAVGTANGNDMTLTTGTQAPVTILPSAITAPAGDITSTSAQLEGSVNPNGLSTTYHFEFGLTIDYGDSTPLADAGAGVTLVPVNAGMRCIAAGALHHYRLVATNTGGTAFGSDLTFISAAAPPAPVPAGKPDGFVLYQNYPNPFNPATQIQYDLYVAGHVSLTIYNALGVEVSTLVSGFQDAGRHLVVWDGKGSVSGVYFCILTVGATSSGRRIVLVK